ncbi:MAG: aminopeptidase [Spirochaetales bacterium]|uniref:Aminopeptidase n=1 Tax=Candidatus Thalassospirochaeta sargassi TaxID=3119039 RepID=A0AAJ1IDG1_9SPIO|nr:aminopeptidase [Spirochaetales bacterium]
MQNMQLFNDITTQEPELAEAARIAVRDVLRVKPDEKVLIITNPVGDVAEISYALYDAALKADAKPVLVFQPVKDQMSFAADEVIGAIGTAPEVLISMSAEKLGKDRAAIVNPWKAEDGTEIDNTFHYLMHTKKTRAFWSPGVTKELFKKTVPIDYLRLKKEAGVVEEILNRAQYVSITSPGGTNLKIGLKGRTAMLDNGDFSAPGEGGNLPAGETFISPELGSSNGRLVFDGSISLYNGDYMLEQPVDLKIIDGFVTSIEGGEGARLLQKTIELGEKNAVEFEAAGRIPAGSGEIYKKNARNLGELGIGLNPAAGIIGNMLGDEKAYRTIHIAIGSNYDEDAKALIHCDCLVKDPTVTAYFADGSSRVFLDGGDLKI